MPSLDLSVSVFLPPPSPEAVLIKAFNVTQEDWWRDVVVICSLGLGSTLNHSDSAAYLTLSSVLGIEVMPCVC